MKAPCAKAAALARLKPKATFKTTFFIFIPYLKKFDWYSKFYWIK